MLISGREAATVLAAVGVTRRQTRIILGAGLAGAPVVTRSAHLYDASRVQEPAGLETGWDLHLATYVRLGLRISDVGFVPLLATVCGRARAATAWSADGRILHR